MGAADRIFLDGQQVSSQRSLLLRQERSLVGVHRTQTGFEGLDLIQVARMHLLQHRRRHQALGLHGSQLIERSLRGHELGGVLLVFRFGFRANDQAESPQESWHRQSLTEQG